MFFVKYVTYFYLSFLLYCIVSVEVFLFFSFMNSITVFIINRIIKIAKMTSVFPPSKLASVGIKQSLKILIEYVIGNHEVNAWKLLSIVSTGKVPLVNLFPPSKADFAPLSGSSNAFLINVEFVLNSYRLFHILG